MPRPCCAAYRTLSREDLRTEETFADVQIKNAGRLGPLEQDHHFVVRGLREHVQHPGPSGAVNEGSAARSRASGLRIAAGVDHVLYRGRIPSQPQSSLPMPRRGGLTMTSSGASSAATAKAAASPTWKFIRCRPCLVAAESGRNDGLTAGFNAGDVAGTGTAQVQGKTADAAVQVPDRPRRQFGDPLLRPCRYRAAAMSLFVWKKLCRPEVEIEVIDTHPQRGLPGEQYLAVAFQDSLVFRVQVDRDNLQLRQGGQERGQMLPDARHQLFRAQDEAEHDLAVRGFGDDQVLELAAAPWTSYGVRWAG